MARDQPSDRSMSRAIRSRPSTGHKLDQDAPPFALPAGAAPAHTSLEELPLPEADGDRQWRCFT
jgi:hypothetical protein